MKYNQQYVISRKKHSSSVFVHSLSSSLTVDLTQLETTHNIISHNSFDAHDFSHSHIFVYG